MTARFVFGFTLLLSASAWAQDQDVQEELDALRKRMETLEHRQAQTTSANPLNVLNPTVTAIGNFLWRLDDRKVYVDNDPAEAHLDDKANLREVELDFRAAVDPYADAVAILSVESEVPGESETGVEEFYIKIKSLPISGWEEPPLGALLKIGRMRTEFGTNNTLHLHDLPQSTRPLAIGDFLGEEGHVASGISARLLLPSPGDSALDLTLQALQGGGIAVADHVDHPAYLANMHLFHPLSEGHSLNASVISFYGLNDENGHNQSIVRSLDAWYRWKPLRQGEWNSFLIGGQVFQADHEFQVDTDGDGVNEGHEATEPIGGFLWGQYQLDRNLYAGCRWDQSDALDSTSRDHGAVMPYLSWYTSEFLRIRFSYQHTSSDNDIEDDNHTFFVELNTVFGAHPPEPFWVNK